MHRIRPFENWNRLESLKKIRFKAAKCYSICICDGEVQGHDGIVFTLNCDKASPIHLMSVSRINSPSVIPIVVMNAGLNLFTFEQVGKHSAKFHRNEITVK